MTDGIGKDVYDIRRIQDGAGRIQDGGGKDIYEGWGWEGYQDGDGKDVYEEEANR